MALFTPSSTTEEALSSLGGALVRVARLRAVHLGCAVCLGVLAFWFEGRQWAYFIGALTVMDAGLLLVSVPALFANSWRIAILHLVVTLAWVGLLVWLLPPLMASWGLL